MATTAYNPLVGRATQLPVGLAGLTIPALSRLSTGVPSASTRFTLSCGQGPSLTIDGKTYPTSVSGTVADLTGLTPLPVHLCTTGTALTLPAGRHWLTSPGTGLPLTVNGLSLKNAPASGSASAPAPATTTAATGRSFTVTDWGTEHRTGTIAAGAQSYLEVHQAASPGWTATAGGQRLAPVTLDGWQQAFIVPAGAGGHVVMTFSPASGYHLWLIIAIVAFAVLLVLALWPRRKAPNCTDSVRRHPPRPRREPLRPRESPAAPCESLRPREPPGPRKPRQRPRYHQPHPPANPGRTTSPSARWELSSRAYWITVIAATVVLALVGGWLAFIVPAVLLVGWAVPRWVPWLAFLAMCVAGGFAIAELNHGPQSGFGAFGPAAQFAAVVALAAALISAPRLGRPTPEPAAAPYGPPFTARDPAPGEGP